MNCMRRQRDEVPLMTSVCTGSLVHASAGLLSHRPATTHLGLSRPTRRARVDYRRSLRHERFVDDGDVITSVGISAGIDMALDLVVPVAGAGRARKVRRGTQSASAPPM